MTSLYIHGLGQTPSVWQPVLRLMNTPANCAQPDLSSNETARRILKEQELSCQEQNDYLILPVLRDEAAAKLTCFLARQHVGVVRLEERQKSLEDIFLELTGKAVSL